MSKNAIIVYHKNAYSIYPKAWIDKFRESILKQTVKDFDIVEMIYGGPSLPVFTDSEGFYGYRELPTFVHAMNHLFDYCTEKGYQNVFNANVDDWFAPNRIERQLSFLNQGYDVVSSNFTLIEDDNEVLAHQFHKLNIKRELLRNHNIIGHPAVAYSRKFFERERYNPDEIPVEDLRLWQRTIDHYKFAILPDQLLFHRLHKNSVCQNSENR